jgi:hypothetical protein
MRKKFQKLKRRNTDSLLGAAILSVRGTTKISHSSAVEWATSFEALLSDKSKCLSFLMNKTFYLFTCMPA